MCNLSDGIEQKGIQKGIARGIQQTVLKALEINPAEKVAEFLQMSLEQVLEIAKNKIMCQAERDSLVESLFFCPKQKILR